MLDVLEMRMNKDNIIKRYVKLFDFCKDANIVVYFHKKTSDAIWKKLALYSDACYYLCN